METILDKNQVTIEDEMRRSYLDYAMSVIIGRALPDVRDGLKPVHRRVLWAMHELGNTSNKPYKKSARVVGDTIGKYHPHGDTAAYDTIVRLAQDFSMRYTLVDGQGNFGCFTGDTKIKLLDGTEKSFAELSELPPDEIFYVYSVDKNGFIVVGEGRHSRITRRAAELIELTLDNAAKIRCTPDHRFLLRSGEYKEAQDLTENDSLMPGYFDTAEIKENLNEYLRVWQPTSEEYEFVHRLADEFNVARGWAREFSGAFVRHHKNFNRFDNRPTNIERIDFLEHLHRHAAHIGELWQEESFRAAQRDGVKKYYAANPQVLIERRERFVTQNQNPQFRQENGQRVGAKLKQKYADNPELRAEISRRMKELWSDTDYQTKMSAALRGIQKRELTLEEKQRVSQIISEKSRAMWQDDEKRSAIVQAITHALSSTEVRAKISASSKKLWQTPEYRAKYAENHFSEMANVLWQKPETRELHREKILRQKQDENFVAAHRAGLKKSNAKRLIENPNMMAEISQLSAASLRQKWTDESYKQQVMRTRFARYGSQLIAKLGLENVSLEIYDANRNANWIPRANKIANYFESFDEFLTHSQNYNHKIVAKRLLEERADVYDITVDVHHNFLLADGVFVHNSVDGDRAAAMRYCLTGQSLTVTSKGLQRIDKVANAEDFQVQILSHEQKINTASKWFDCGEFPVFTVKTRHGYEITGTQNHPLLCWKADANSKPHFVWKTISELQTGDFLVLDRSEFLWRQNKISLIKLVPKIEIKSRTERHELPPTLTEDLAFLLGALTAEGTVQNNKIEFGNTEGEFADKFIEVWERTFPTCKLHRWLREPHSYGKKTWWQMQIVSKQVVEFFRNLGLHGKSSEREIPELILASPQKVVAAFLRGLYEGDGSVERSGKNLLRVTLTSNSETMLKQLQVLLLRFGIVTNRFCDASHGHSTHRLCVTGAENLNKFADNIGFSSSIKTDALNAILALSSGKALTKNDFVPHLAEFVRARDLGNQRNWFLKNNFDRLPRLQKTLPRLKTALAADDFAFVENLANSNNLFDQIVSVESAGEQRVYSIRVDSDCHSFVANGFINHNTEIRLEKLSNEILADIEKETVNFQPNYDESLSEPVVMPVRFPNLLVNGSEGIAVGMATKIPPHNLTEILEATMALVKNPDIQISELIKIVPGPDFPTGGFIYGREEIHRAYREGRGVIQLRARAAIDRIGRGGDREKDAIVITEIPYQVNKARLIEQIADLVNEKRLDGISEMRDESNREGMRIVIELKRDAIPQVVLNKLYKLTPMQTSFGIIMLAILNGQPRVLNIKQVLEAFIDFRREVIRRRTEFELRKAKARAHILEGLDKAIDALDYIVPLVRNSRSLEEAKAWLTGNPATLREQKTWKGAPAEKTLAGFLKELETTMNRLQFSEIQAQAILDLQLRRLSALERQKIADELAGLRIVIADLESILENETVLRAVITKELETVKKDFGDKRKTEIVDAGIEIRIEDLIADEEVAITVTNAGYIKRTAVSTYSKQNRGGKGRFGATAKNEDFVEHLFTASTHDSLMIFTDDGQVFKMKVHEIPDGAAASRGKAIVNVINIPSTRKAVGVIPVRDFTEEKFVLMVTKKGVVKKTALAGFQHIRVNGINAVNVDEGDELLDVILTDGNHQIFIATNNGLAIRFDESDVRAMGRAARGVRGINLRKNDVVIGVVCVSKEGEDKLLSISEQGYGKQTKVKDYRLQTRGGFGVINMKANEKTGKVVAVFPVSEDAEVMIITQQAKLIRLGANEIRSTGRSASGVRLIRTGEDDIVTSASLLDSVTDDEEDGEEAE